MIVEVERYTILVALFVGAYLAFYISFSSPSRFKAESIPLRAVTLEARSDTPNLSNCPRIALLFLTVKGLLQRDIWEQWIDLAFTEEQLFGDSVLPPHMDLTMFRAPNNTINHSVKRHELLMPSQVREVGFPSDPLYEFAHPPSRCGNTPERASIYSMMVGSLNLSHAEQTLPEAFPNSPLNCSLVSPPQTRHMASNSAQTRLYAEAFKDPRNFYFMVISESTIPVQSFGDMYDSLFLSNRSLIEPMGTTYSNVAFKHSQWTILNRKHVEILLNDKQNVSSLGTEYYRGQFAGEEEIRQGTILGLELGNRQFWREVNDGQNLASYFSQKRHIRTDDNGSSVYYSSLVVPLPTEIYLSRPTAAFWRDIQTEPVPLTEKGLELEGFEPKTILGIDEKEFFAWVSEQQQMVSMVRKVKGTHCLDRRNRNSTISECVISMLSEQQMVRNKYRKQLT